MAANDYSGWAKYLHDPLVLVGFALLILAGVVTLSTVSKKPLRQQKGLLWFLILVSVTIVLCFSLAFNKQKMETAVPKTKIEQKSSGNQSPNVVTGGNANISFGGKYLEGEKMRFKNTIFLIGLIAVCCLASTSFGQQSQSTKGRPES